jgi:hypothetical protein
MQPYENFIDYSTHFGNMFATPKHVPCDDLEDQELYANEEQNCSKPCFCIHPSGSVLHQVTMLHS